MGCRFKIYRLLLGIGIVLANVACTSSPTQSSSQQALPNKYATGFHIIDEDTCLLLEVMEPHEQYRIAKPLNRIATSSTTQIGFLGALNALDKVVAVCNPELIYTTLPSKPIDLGDSMKPSSERALQAQLDALLVVSYGQNNPEAERLARLGVKTIYINEWREESPLARAEWVRFVGALVGKLEMADSLFDCIEQRYLAEAERQTMNRGTVSVMLGNNFKGTWYMPSGNTYMGYLLHDAGADYRYAEDMRGESVPMTVEQVLNQFSEADVWIGASANSMAELADLDEKHQWFKAYKNGRVYNWRKQYRMDGANNFWERGVVHPEEILSDIVNVLDGAPDSTLHYANRLY